MEIDTEKFKTLVVEMFGKFRELETELMAYKMVIHVVKAFNLAEPDLPWEESLEVARKNPLLTKMMADKYDPAVVAVRESIDQAQTAQGLSEWFRKWKPSGPVN